MVTGRSLFIHSGIEQTDFKGLSANEIDKFFDYGDEQDPGRDDTTHL